MVNLGGAKSADFLELLRKAQETVRQKFHIELETEVKVMSPS